MRTQYIQAIADDRHEVNGVKVTGSFQTVPQSSTPYKVRGVSYTDKTKRHVEIRLSIDEARKLVNDWVSFGLFGRHGRIETTKA